MQKRGWTLRSDIIWNRINAFAEPTARDRPFRQHEHIFLFAKTRFYSYDRSQLPGQDIWNIPIERNTIIEHNAAFPSELVRRCILSGSPVGGYVLDPFVGSGTTIDVSRKLKRHCVGIDLSQQYVQELTKHLLSDGYVSTSWNNLCNILSSKPIGWDSWAGNKANYRKPGTNQKKLSDVKE